MAISETKGQGVESYPYPVKEGQRYINLCVGHIDVPCKEAEPIEMPSGGRLRWAEGTMY